MIAGIQRLLVYFFALMIGPFVGGLLLTLFPHDAAYALYALFFAAALVVVVILTVKGLRGEL